MNILAIDPGNVESGIAIMSDEYDLLAFGKINNVDLLQCRLPVLMHTWHPQRVIIEEIASYGMAVGASVFETCIWIGRFMQWLSDNFDMDSAEFCPDAFKVETVKRKRYITELCGDPRAKDKNVKAYLIERFAPGVSNFGKGTRKNPGKFYGVANDVWSAIGIGTWYIDNFNGNISHT